MLIEKLKERFGADVVEASVTHNEETVVVERDRALEILRTLRDDPEFACEFLIDVTAVDWLGRKPRFDVVYNLKSITRKHRIRVKIRVDGDDPWVPSATGIWKSANWLERECYDMFGVEFTDHPDLRRILMPENYAEGHPLRKDFPLRGRFTRAEQTRRALSLGVDDFYIPDELGVREPHGQAAPSDLRGAAAPTAEASGEGPRPESEQSRSEEGAQA